MKLQFPKPLLSFRIFVALRSYFLLTISVCFPRKVSILYTTSPDKVIS